MFELAVSKFEYKTRPQAFQDLDLPADFKRRMPMWEDRPVLDKLPCGFFFLFVFFLQFSPAGPFGPESALRACWGPSGLKGEGRARRAFSGPNGP